MEDETRTYRITWRHEVYINAKNPKELLDKWESLDLGKLDIEKDRQDIKGHDYVEIISREDDNHDEVHWEDYD